MLKNMRRLHPRGPTSRGLAVDADGAMLGPNCGLVRRTIHGYRSANREEAAAIRPIAFGGDRRPDWLFDQCCRIAEALNDNEVALAQIYGVHASPDDLDDQKIAKLTEAALLLKENFNPDEPRVPAGEPDAGQWTTEDGTSAAGDRKSICIDRCAHLLERQLPYRWSNLNTFAFYRCINDCMSEAG